MIGLVFIAIGLIPLLVLPKHEIPKTIKHMLFFMILTGSSFVAMDFSLYNEALK